MFRSPCLIHENSSSYASFPLGGMVYEISLRVRDSREGLKDLMQAHRLVRSLLQGEILDLYGLLDFVIWPQGLFLRISLKKFSTLSEFLAFLKTQNLYPGHSSEDFWNDDLEWIRVVPPEKLDESTQRFWDQAFQLREELQATKGFDPNLFFFYRKSDL